MQPARSRPSLLLVALLLSAAALPGTALAAGSVIVQGASKGGGSVSRAQPAVAAPRASDPQQCAAAFHERLKAVREGPYAALKALGAPLADAASPAMVDTTFLFPPSSRPRTEAETRALRSAAAFLRRGPGAAPMPLTSDGRWVAARLREDLADFLTQSQTTYLCSGTAEYLAILRRQAERIGPSGDRRGDDLLVQREAARRLVAQASRLMEPAPVPTAAPEREMPAVASGEALRRSVGMEAESVGPPAPSMLVAASHGATRISEGDFDTDLPPLGHKPEWRLESEGDILAAIDRLADEARVAGLLAPEEAGGADTITTGAITTAAAPERAVPARLLVLRDAVAGSPSLRTDGLLRSDLVAALSSLEVLDTLRLAAAEPADPLPAAFEAVFRAIETAREESGRLAP
ncbi:hypothetical protein [Aureimonas jatrophae]|uniref:Uncharacterized protein n=1 Tax=Aureimonas jatrophae TaxID=1166073 RepID=A0A1H0L1Q9_9HYPH|nr:hypothetical protein [Aureimonas jatrophae]MBB3952376.1 hypothetical protein [Aureimonas jatrophae]SDO62167.1 hypothetical protein SAMN05192530_1098 [Aureimonas jatrophae]